MKRILLCLFVLALLAAMNAESRACPRVAARDGEDFPGTAFRKYVPLSFTGELDADSTHSYDALSLDAVFNPDIPARTFAAEVEMTLRVMDDEITSFPVNLAECTVSGVSFGQLDATWNHDNDVVTVFIPDELLDEDTLTVRISYIGLLRDDNYFGGMIYSNSFDVLYTFGEPYQTRYWLACYDQPFDKLDEVRISVVLPEDYKVVSNGDFISAINDGEGNIETAWQSTDPISTYLISIAAHPYIRIEDGEYGVNDTPVSFWVYPADSSRAHFEFGRTGEMIEVFENLFGPYPFNKYDQAMAPIFNGWGAMEHQSATTYGSRLVTYFDDPRRYEGIVAHELGHQWWGDMVGPLTFAHIWLNEGFASYCEALWDEHLGEEEFRDVMSRFRENYFWEDSNQARYAIYNPPADFLFGTAIYDKGAWVLHMLRWMMGDDDFFTGMQQYGATYAYGSAIIPDFQEAMENASGLDLDNFFQQWIYNAGYPIYNFDAFSVTGNPDDGYTAHLGLTQSQTNAPLFTTPLPIRFFNNEEDTLARVDVAALPEQTLTFAGLPFEPTGYEFDPDEWILCQYSVNGVDGEPQPPIPGGFALSSPYPNPFNGATRVTVSIPRNGEWRVEVFDLLGRRVALLKDGAVRSGRWEVVWRPGANVSSGTYLLSARLMNEQRVRRLVLIR